jgi:hypothetical protein
VKEFTVVPIASPALSAVITVTPVTNIPHTRRSAAPSTGSA